MIKFLEQLFCKHNWVTDDEGNRKYYREEMAKANKEGADSIAFSFKHECTKCNKEKWCGGGLEAVY